MRGHCEVFARGFGLALAPEFYPPPRTEAKIGRKNTIWAPRCLFRPILASARRGGEILGRVLVQNHVGTPRSDPAYGHLCWDGPQSRETIHAKIDEWSAGGATVWPPRGAQMWWRYRVGGVRDAL